jgi:capsular polysaccharide biosynthesis protein
VPYLCVLLVVIPAASAYVISSLQQDRYGARSEVVYQVVNSQTPQLADQELRTQLLLMTGRATLSAVAADYGMSLADLEDAVQVEQPNDSQMLRLTVTGKDRDRIKKIATSIVDAYAVAVRAGDTTLGQRQVLQETLTQLQGEREKASRKLIDLSKQRSSAEAAGNPADVIRAEQSQSQADMNALTARTTDVQRRLVALQVAAVADAPRVRVTTPAYIMDEPVSPRPLRDAAGGVLVGLLLAAGLLLVVSRTARD